MFTKNSKIGIIAAMDEEIQELKDMAENVSTEVISGVTFVSGILGGVNVVMAKCGIGKVFAAICTQAMILTYKPDLIINIGVGGSLSKNLKIADIAISESVVQHDMDTSPIGDPYGYLNGLDKVFLPACSEAVSLVKECADELGINNEIGVVASGDCFVSSTEKKSFIIDTFKGIVCEMEGASVGHVCYVNGTDYCIIRAISDSGDEDAKEDYPVSLGKASKAAMSVMKLFLEKLN